MLGGTYIPRADQTQRARWCLKGLSSTLRAAERRGTCSCRVHVLGLPFFLSEHWAELTYFSKNTAGEGVFLPSAEVHLLFSLEVSVLKPEFERCEYNFCLCLERFNFPPQTGCANHQSEAQAWEERGKSSLQVNWVSPGTLDFSPIPSLWRHVSFVSNSPWKKDLKNS